MNKREREQLNDVHNNLMAKELGTFIGFIGLLLFGLWKLGVWLWGLL